MFTKDNNPFLNSSNKGNPNSLFGNDNKSTLFQNNAPGTNSLFENSLFGAQTHFPNDSSSFLNNPSKPSSDENKNNLNPFNIFNKAKDNDKSKEVEEQKKINITGESLFGNMQQNTSLFNNNANLFSQNQKNDSTLFPFQSDNKGGDKNFFFNNKKDTENNKKENDENKKDNKMEGSLIFNNKDDNNKENNFFTNFNSNKDDKEKSFNFGFGNKNDTNKNNNFGKIFTNTSDKVTPTSNPKKEINNISETNNKSSFNPFENKDNETNSQNKTKENNLSTNFNINTSSNNNEINIKSDFNFNNNIKEEDDKNENEEMEMEIDEDIKKDSSSNNSEILNKLWISDNEEIIDDEVDTNKKIDYKMLEEKSKNKQNKINDINLLILPELSEYYFNKSKSISEYYTNSDSNIRDKFSIEISRKIIDILSKIIKEKNLDEEKESELINITTIYIYFDAFILHRNDVIYLMKLRDELLYKYYITSETLINFESKNNIIYDKENNNINSIITILKKLYFHLTMLDIDKAYQQIGLLMQLYESIFRKKILGDKTMKFNDLFMNLEKIIKIYNNIYSLKENFNSKQIISSFNMFTVFKEVSEILQEMQYEKDTMKENAKIIFIECQKIIGLLMGNFEFLINEYNKDNIHLIIMANIFYRFYKNDFIKGIEDTLKNKNSGLNMETDLINKIIMKIIQNCDQNQIEIVQELKGNYPFLLRYHMIEILSQNAFLFQVENQENFLKKEAFLLFENFRDLKIPFKYHLNYLSFYPNYEIFTVDNINDIDNLDEDPSEELKEKGYRKALDYALVYINSRFNNEENVEDIKNEIDEIKNEIGNKIIDTYSNDILYKINKLCLVKYSERKSYKYSILSYIENYNLENKDLKKLQIRQQRNQLCADNELNYEYPKQFDKVIINFYLITNYVFNLDSFRDIYENQKGKIDQEYKDIQELLNIILNKKEQSSIDNSVQFIINYAQFLLDVMRHHINLIEKNNKYNIDIVLSCKKFFMECFPLPKCPVFIWYHILMIIKNVIDENIELFSSDTFIGENEDLCEDVSIWDNKLIYEIIKVEKMKGNEIRFEGANIMYENAISFVNDITQGFYFNENLFSNSQNINY